MTQDFVMGQLRLALVALLAFAGGKGWLTPTDSSLVLAFITALGPLFAPWIWSIVSNINTKRVPQHLVVIDPVVTPANSDNVTATVKTAAGTMTGKVVSALLIAFVISAFLAGNPAGAQTKLRLPIDPLGLNAKTAPTSNDPLANIVGALDAKLLPDLQYAKAMADASGSKVTGPCYGAWIDLINVRQKAVADKDGQALPFPDPGLVSRFEQIVELRNALQPDSTFMIACSPVASMVKKDIVGFIGIVISGGAGLATLVPGL